MPAPNVLWIITDDQMRSTLPTMPHVWRRLAAKGARFPNAYAAVPWCGPARASMLTSRYVHDHGCTTNQTHRPFVRRGLDQDTVATRMSAAGYATGYFGKYMNGLARDPSYVAPGWDRWVGLVGTDGKVNVDGQVRTLDDPRELDRFAAERLRRFVRRRAPGPWFAVLATTSPHDPYTPSRKHADDFDSVAWDPPAFNEADMSDKPSWMQDLPRQRRREMREVYEGKLEELRDADDLVAGALRVLWRTGQLANTWIFYVSDNGYLLGEHRLFRKEQPYEESVGIPYVVRGPGVAPGTPEALVSQVDLMPTTLEIAGLDPDAGRALSGRSMLGPLTTGDWSGWRSRLLIENVNLGWAMLREGSTAYIDHHERGEWELYDLASDPHQLSSLRDAVVTGFAEATTGLRGSVGLDLRAIESL
jgi:N-acetylglucosamine-6-sulfatase